MTSHAFHQVSPRKSKKQSAEKPAAAQVPQPLASLLRGLSDSPILLWGLPRGRLTENSAWLVTELDRLARPATQGARRGTRGSKRDAARQAERAIWQPRVDYWLSELDSRLTVPSDERVGELLLEAIAWCHALPRMRKILDDALCETLHERLQQLAREGCEQLAAIPPWPFHLCGELTCALAFIFPTDPLDSGWQEKSREGLTHGICELTDGEGQLHARHLAWSHPLLACWTRCETMVRHRHPGNSCFLQEGEEQFHWFVQQTLRWTRRDGRLAGITGAAEDPMGLRELWESVLAIQDDPVTRFLAAAVLPKTWELTSRRDALPKQFAEPSPSMVGEWAEVAILRSDWQRNAPQLSVTFHDSELRSELSVGKRVIWSGSHLPNVVVDGVPLTNPTAGEVVCIFSDEDAEYVEIELEYPGQWRLQRQMLLGRADQFLLIADALLGPQAAEICYEHRLPLTGEVQFRGEAETQEGGLMQDDRELVRVLPLALPEWRSTRQSGNLAAIDGGVQLKQQTTGTALFCPLFFDLSSKRRGKPLTWRQLTVAERLQIQPPDVAVGYRVQVGKQQWLIYRSLRQPAARSVLGQHFSQEFVLGRFTPAGELEQILQIE